MKKLLLLSATLFILSSCYKRITVNYQSSSENTGTIVIQPTKKTPSTNVVMNDTLTITQKKRVKSVTINNVPVGTHTISYTTYNPNYQYPLDTTFKIKMDTSKRVTKTVVVPPYSIGYHIYSGLVMIAVILFIL